MHINDIRLNNFELILFYCFGDIKRQMALALDVKPFSLSRYSKDAQQPRAISSEIARQLEALVGLPKHWMESYQTSVPGGTKVYVVNSRNEDFIDTESMTVLHKTEDLIEPEKLVALLVNKLDTYTEDQQDAVAKMLGGKLGKLLSDK